MRLLSIFYRSHTKKMRFLAPSWNFLSRMKRLQSTESTQNQPENYKIIYKNSGIKLVSAFASLKKYQIIATAVVIPMSGLLEFSQVIEPGYFLLTTVLGTSTSATLCGMGFLLKNVVGFMYLDESENQIKLAYVDFWGQRKDVTFPVEDLKPLSEVHRRFTDALFITLERYSTPETYKLNIRQGTSIEKEKLVDILGDIERK